MGFVKRPVKLPSAAIFDIDGTLALMKDRGPFEWHKVGNDAPNTPIVTLANMLFNMGIKIIVMSGRDSVCREVTERWLYKHIYYHHLFMRPEKDHRKDAIIKEELFREHVEGKFEVLWVFDDRDQVVDLWRNKLGLTCLQVAYGNF